MIKQINKGLALLLATVMALSLSGALITAFASPTDDGVYEYNVDEGSESVVHTPSVVAHSFTPFWTFPDSSMIPGRAHPDGNRYYTLYWYCPQRVCPHNINCCDHVFRIFVYEPPDTNDELVIRVFLVESSEQPEPDNIRQVWYGVFETGTWPTEHPYYYYFPMPVFVGVDEYNNDINKVYILYLSVQGNRLRVGTRIESPGCTCHLKDLIVEKVWSGDDGPEDLRRPDYIQFHLLRDEAVYSPYYYQFLRASEGWRVPITGLNRRCPEGYISVFSAEELDVPGYSSEVTPARLVDGVYVITITNTLIYEPVLYRTPLDKRVVKVWDDSNNVEGLRPGRVEVRLLKNEEVYRTVFLNEANNWSHDFPNLFVYDEDGIDYDFEIIEIVPYRYDDCIVLNVNTGVWTITNTLIQEQPGIRDPDTRQHGRQQQDGRAPQTGDFATTLPLLASILLSVSAVLGGTSLRNRFRK